MIGVLFDLDGTLLDTLGDLADAVNYSLGKFGYPQRTQEEVRTFVGDGSANLIRRSVPQSVEYAPVLEIFLEYYPGHSQIKTGPYAGVLAALEAVKDKYPVAVVSNKLDGPVKRLCAQYFGDVYALGEVAGCPRKPAPDMLYKAMEAIGVDRCIYVGDSEVDVITAANIGAECVSVTWGFRDAEELVENGARHLCHNTSELPAIIDKIAEEYYGK